MKVVIFPSAAYDCPQGCSCARNNLRFFPIANIVPNLFPRWSLMWPVLICGFLCLLIPKTGSAATEKWKSENLTIQLSEKGQEGNYTGTIIFDGVEFSATATHEGNGYSGHFETSGMKFPFSLTPKGNQFLFESGGNQYPVMKELPTAQNPFAKPTTENPFSTAVQSKKPHSDPVRSCEFTSGFRIEIPASWQVTPSNQGVVIFPDDIQHDPSGNPLELLVLSATSADGIIQPDDPRVGQFFDSEYKSNFPTFQRAQNETQMIVTSKGPAAVFNYRGKLPNGEDGLHQIYVTIHENVAAFLIHMGQQNLVNARQSGIAAIWKTLDRTAPQLDAALIRSWRFSETQGSSGFGNYMGSTTEHVWEFNASGNVAYATKTYISGTTSGTSASIDGSWDISYGHFSIRGSQLQIQWTDGGSSTYSYAVVEDSSRTPTLKLQRSDWDRPKYFQ